MTMRWLSVRLIVLKYDHLENVLEDFTTIARMRKDERFFLQCRASICMDIYGEIKVVAIIIDELTIFEI